MTKTLRFTERPSRSGNPAEAPVLFLLHGYSQNRHSLPYLLSDVLAALPEFRIISVEGPVDLGRHRYAWCSLTCEGREYADRPVENIPGRVKADAPAFLRSRDAVADLLRQKRTDSGKTFVLGFSQGASLCLSLLAAYPSLAGHYLPLSGFPLPGTVASDPADGRLKGIKVLAFHGTEDPLVPFAQGKETLCLYRSGGAEYRFLPFRGGHAIVPEEKAGIVRWLREAASLSPVSQP